ncbi:hypothetical protein B0H10DRAFT_1953338 [Mycena sp. CBHHK59/15]|nr:hypothetical protein B0H10DRAFT_1953338 [Mycena sp. CBHHK59/15]
MLSPKHLQSTYTRDLTTNGQNGPLHPSLDDYICLVDDAVVASALDGIEVPSSTSKPVDRESQSYQTLCVFLNDCGRAINSAYDRLAHAHPTSKGCPKTTTSKVIDGCAETSGSRVQHKLFTRVQIRSLENTAIEFVPYGSGNQGGTDALTATTKCFKMHIFSREPSWMRATRALLRTGKKKHQKRSSSKALVKAHSVPAT